MAIMVRSTMVLAMMNVLAIAHISDTISKIKLSYKLLFCVNCELII
jgi:hypothetical protein